MNRFRLCRRSAAAAVLAATAVLATICPLPAAAAEAALAQRFSATLAGDVTTVGAAVPACAPAGDCPETSTAELGLPSRARVVYARLLWATGLDAECAASPVPDRPRLGVTGTDGGTAWSPVAGQVTGARTAEAEVTAALSAAPPASVTVAGLRGDDCAAGWSLVLVYTEPEARPRYVSVQTGASAAGLTIEGFQHHGEDPARLSATVHGGGVEVNGTAIDGGEDAPVIDAAVPSGAIGAGDTSAEIAFDDGSLAQQVALSVPVATFDIAATATPSEIGPGSTVVHTVTATNTTNATAGLRLSVDLRRALDDASGPVGIAVSTGSAEFTGTRLAWRGEVPAGATASVSYTVTVKNPRPGDGRLESTVIAGPASNCPAGEPEPACVVELRFPPRPPTGDVGAAGAPGARLPVTGTALTTPAALGLAAAALGALLLAAVNRRAHRR